MTVTTADRDVAAAAVVGGEEFARHPPPEPGREDPVATWYKSGWNRWDGR